jgi:hypothetical protein
VKLFQYWDTGDPPADVAGWIEGFRRLNPDLDHQVYDERAAEAFIAASHGARHAAAFRACAVPSMQADYFRMCAIDAEGGVFMDADFQARAPLASLLETAPTAAMLQWHDQLMPGFMFARAPGEPLFSAALELATRNIETRAFPSVQSCAGPGVFNALRGLVQPETFEKILPQFRNIIAGAWGMPELLETARRQIPVTAELIRSVEGLTLVTSATSKQWFGADAPAYKSTPRHWLNWSGSIFREAAQARHRKARTS